MEKAPLRLPSPLGSLPLLGGGCRINRLEEVGPADARPSRRLLNKAVLEPDQFLGGRVNEQYQLCVLGMQ